MCLRSLCMHIKLNKNFFCSCMKYIKIEKKRNQEFKLILHVFSCSVCIIIVIKIAVRPDNALHNMRQFYTLSQRDVVLGFKNSRGSFIFLGERRKRIMKLFFFFVNIIILTLFISSLSLFGRSMWTRQTMHVKLI